MSDLKLGEQNHKVTLVTALYDLGRDDIGPMSRSFSRYLDLFSQLLTTDYNFVVFTDKETKKTIQEKNGLLKNVVFVDKTIEQIFDANKDIFEKVESIRKDGKWINGAGWLPDAPQAKLKYYNPLVMSKMFLLNDARIYNFFNTDYFYWIDAGIINTVPIERLEEIKNVPPISGPNVLFLSFPYDNNKEIHGFPKNEMDRYAEKSVDMVCRGGFFGGHKLGIIEANKHYYELLKNTVYDGFVGTEENIFTLMYYIAPKEYRAAQIESNGLIYRFFDDVRGGRPRMLGGVDIYVKRTTTNVYVLAYESPDQLDYMLDSFEHQSEFLSESQKYLIDNSNGDRFTIQYQRIAAQYDFKYIKSAENIGVCGGRQFVAEHFDQSGADYYVFFEDDMLFDHKEGVSKSGFPKRIPNLWDVMHRVLIKENFDFLKLTFDEFYGSNESQWAFMNVSQELREKYWPGRAKSVLNLPRTEYRKLDRVKISQENLLTYAAGDVYYCNWPLLFGRQGNMKIFLNEKIKNPYENDWMSRAFSLQKKGELSCGVLLCSPIYHDRIYHYDKEIRKEN